MRTEQTPQGQQDKVRQEARRALKELADQIAEWVRTEPNWKLEQPDKYRPEDVFGAYTMPILLINTPRGKLALEDVRHDTLGREVVEFYAWPTLYRVHLVRGEQDLNWRIRTDSGVYLRQEWNRENFVTLANDLLAAS